MKAWLYPFPDFISPHSQPPYKPMHEEIGSLDLRLKIDLQNRTDNSLRRDLDAILKRGVDVWKSSKGWRGGKETFSVYSYSAILVNIGKHRRNEPNIEWCDAQELDLELCQARSQDNAKKRFQYVQYVKMDNSMN